MGIRQSSSSVDNLLLHENVVACSEGDADEDEEEVGDGEVQDQQVGRVLHLRVRHHLLKEDYRHGDIKDYDVIIVIDGYKGFDDDSKV